MKAPFSQTTVGAVFVAITGTLVGGLLLVHVQPTFFGTTSTTPAGGAVEPSAVHPAANGEIESKGTKQFPRADDAVRVDDEQVVDPFGWDSSIYVVTSVPILSPQTIDAMELAVSRYSTIVAQGGWPPIPAGDGIRLGVRNPSVAILRDRLAISGDFAPTAGVSDTFDSFVEAAVRRFQARHGIQPHGVVTEATLTALNVPAHVRLAQLGTNLARLRALTAKPTPSRFAVVNIAAASVEVVEAGRVTHRFAAVVGNPERPSPIVNSELTSVSFNGSRGAIAINLASIESFLMSDAPDRSVFNDDYRFDTSGDVWVQNIAELAAWVLEDTPGWDRDRINVASRSARQGAVKASTPAPIFWTYISAWSTLDGVVQFREDVYRLDTADQNVRPN